MAHKAAHPQFYSNRGLQEAVFFDRETFGTEKLVVGKHNDPKVIARYPLSARAREDVIRIETGHTDYMPGVSSAEKKLRLSKMSYRDFLRDVVKVDPMTLALYQAQTHGLWGAGIDAVSALDCWGVDFPGFKGMKLAPGSIARMGFTPAGFADTGGSKTFHFPDGNATIARLLGTESSAGRCAGETRQRTSSWRAVAYDKARSTELADPIAPEQHRRARGECWGFGGARRRSHLYPVGEELHGARAELCARVLQHDDSLPVPGIAGGTEGRAAQPGEDAAGVYERRAA